MKDPVRKLISILLFETLVTPENINVRFSTQQKSVLAQPTGWSTAATRQRLIYQYWFTHVTEHFLLIICLPVLFTIHFTSAAALPASMFGIITAGMIIYLALYLFLYRPLFESVFLPQLENIKETWDRQLTLELEKCRKSQLSNFALTLVFYVIDKSCNLNSLQCNEESAKRIARLYGVDSGSIKKNLSLIIGKKVPIAIRKRTEIQNQFEEAYGYLNELNFKKGIELLRQVEQRILHRAL